MTTLHFNFKDMFRSVRLAFSLQRIWIQFVGLLGAYIGYFILTYLAFLISGEGIVGVWHRYGLLPVIPGTYVPVQGIIVYGLAVFVLVYGYMITATGVARAVYMNLKGNTFYTWKEALAFAFKKKLSILGTPFSLAVMIMLFVLGGGLMGLIGKIPYAGELFMSVFSIFWILATLFLVFVGIALIVSLFLTPAILATTDDDAFEGIFQSFSIAFTQPWRLLIYQILNVVTSVFGLITFTLLIKYSWKLLNIIFTWSMGDKFVRVATAASYYVQSLTYPFVLFYKDVLGDYGNIFFYTHRFTSEALEALHSWSEGTSAIILAIVLIILGGYVMSFPLAVFNTGHTLGFLVIKKFKDDENLLERKDREEEDDEEDEEVKSIEEEKPAEEVKKKTEAKKSKGKKKKEE
ncbi:hypothetical protein JW835_13530 [bacterium]|nr:hypothetical protein [bacterium]